MQIALGLAILLRDSLILQSDEQPAGTPAYFTNSIWDPSDQDRFIEYAITLGLSLSEIEIPRCVICGMWPSLFVLIDYVSPQPEILRCDICGMRCLLFVLINYISPQPEPQPGPSKALPVHYISDTEESDRIVVASGDAG